MSILSIWSIIYLIFIGSFFVLGIYALFLLIKVLKIYIKKNS